MADGYMVLYVVIRDNNGIKLIFNEVNKNVW